MESQSLPITENENQQPRYGYSYQLLSVDNFKLRDQVFINNIYTNIDLFVECVNNELDEYIKCYEGFEEIENENEYYTAIETFTKEKSKHFLECYPITKEYILSLSNYFDYVYYDKQGYWALAIIKHTII